MAKNNNNNGVENKNKKKDGGEKKKAIASKIVKWVKSFQGAESVKSEGQANKLTVVGKVDPTKLRDELATTTKNKVDLVSPQPKKDNKVNKDDANDTKEKKPEKTDNDEKAKETAFTMASRMYRERLFNLKKNGGNDGNSGNDGNDGEDGDDGNDGNDGSGDEKKKKEDEGNGGGKMKYPAGQSGFGQYPHRYGYQNGALKMGENMLLLCCEVFGLLVMYSHLPKDIYTNVTLNTQWRIY